MKKFRRKITAKVVELNVRVGQLERMVHEMLFGPDEQPDVLGFHRPPKEEDDDEFVE